MSVNKKVIDLLQETLEQDPQTEELFLEFMSIKDLLPFMELLSEFKNLRSLSLHSNSIQELPLDMSSLESLQKLTLSNNLLKDARMVAESLATLPNLKILHYPVKKQKESILIQKLKTLTNLNNVEIIREYMEKPADLKYMNQQNFNTMRKDFLKYYKKIIHFESAYLEDKNPDHSEDKFKAEINQIINNAFEKLNEKQGNIQESLELVIYNITQNQAFEMIKNRLIDVCVDMYGEMGKFMREISEYQENIWKAITTQALELCKSEEQFLDMKKERDIQLKSGLTLQNRLIKKTTSLEKQVKRLKRNKEELIAEINRLENQNGRYLETLVRFSKGDKKNLSAYVSNIHPPPVVNPHQKPVTSSIPAHANREKHKNSVKDSIQMNYVSNGRNLTLKQLKDTIEEIYEHKLKYDQKNFDGKLPRETMHQYLFTHLNQKYGLKNLTIEAASSIVSGIQSYSPEDNDVAVFGKILRNQVDEQFRNVQTELKSTIHSLLKMHIKNQHPYKSASEIESVFKEKINHEITSEEVEDIVKYLYNKTDSDRILHKLQMLYKLNKPKEEVTHRRFHRQDHSLHEKEKKKIKFSLFVQAVLDFQLRNHQKLLQPLVSIFRHRDTDCDGIVNEDQFISIIEQLCEEANEILPELLMIVDPYETKTITFTQMVRLVANYPQSNPILSRFIDKDEGIQDEEEYL